MKFEYKVLNMPQEVERLRRLKYVGRNISHDAVYMEVINEQGEQGWKALNLPNPNEIYFERQLEKTKRTKTLRKQVLHAGQ